MSELSDWNDLVTEFRALGGIADNVTLGTGPLGRGLFTLDPAQPSKIQVPENLLISVSDTVFENGQLRIKPDANVPARERALFEFFEERFSWGSGGRRDCEDFLARVDTLPDEVHSVLVRDLGLKLFAMKSSPARAEQRFLRSRMMTYGDRYVLMPLMELANHGTSGSSFDTNNGVTISGYFTSEVFAHYGMVDPYAAFEVWSFASSETLAFSLPATMPIGKRQITILRQLSNRKVRGSLRVPVLSTEDDKVTISYLMLGHAKFPRLSKGIFYQFMSDIGADNAEELFDRVRRFNIDRFLKLMEVLEPHQGDLISTLRSMCRHQIAATTHAIGTRPI
jgi:hypothetical protein